MIILDLPEKLSDSLNPSKCSKIHLNCASITIIYQHYSDITDMARLAISSACSFYGLRRGEFNLLIIDEPQQHLDSKHKEKFARDFLAEICKKCQVVLATADEKLWELMGRYAPKETIFYEITDWSLEKGPEIIRRV